MLNYVTGVAFTGKGVGGCHERRTSPPVLAWASVG
jgi:hypothetical protein